MTCPSCTSELFRSSSAASFSTRRTSSRAIENRCGLRIGQKRPDRVVQALRFAQHDVHQLRLLFGERQLLPENLNRSRHRRQRIANLVRDAGRHLADRRETLPQPRVALELLDVGDVLKREQQPGVAARRPKWRGREPQVDLPAVAGPVRSSRCGGPATGRQRCASSPATFGGSSSTSSMRRPTTESAVWPVIASAARLNVRIRP